MIHLIISVAKFINSTLSKYRKKLRYWSFILSKPVVLVSTNTDQISKIAIMTIAFNEVDLVEKQIILLKKNLTDLFTHIIVDNSSDELIRRQIQKVCLVHGVEYASVPVNPYSSNKSHAAAMHWAYFQIVRKSNFKKFGYLDHDIFPINPYSLLQRMNEGLYGRVMHSYTKNSYQAEYSSNVPYWSLWAGFCFFDRSLVNGDFPWSFNFFSKHFKDGFFLDTGGGLWDSLYSQIRYPGSLAHYELLPFSKLDDEGIQNQNFEMLDSCWIHFVSLSNWRKIKDIENKKEVLNRILKSALESN